MSPPGNDPFLGSALTYARGIGVPEEKLEGLETANEVYEAVRQHLEKQKSNQYNKARSKRVHDK